MLFDNATQFAVLALVLVIGWLFGFASHPGGRKWKQAYRDETAARAAERDALNARLRDSEARIATLETNNAKLARSHAAAPVPVARDVTAASAAHPAFGAAAATPPAPRKRGWFDWSRGDDLTRLRGVDGDLSRALKAERVDSFADIAGLSDQDEIALERRLDLPAGYIQREQWREQARLLADGQDDAWTTRFG